MFPAGPCTTRAQRRPGRRRTERPAIFVTDVVGQAGSAGPAPSRSDLRLKVAIVTSHLLLIAHGHPILIRSRNFLLQMKEAVIFLLIDMIADSALDVLQLFVPIVAQRVQHLKQRQLDLGGLLLLKGHRHMRLVAVR